MILGAGIAGKSAVRPASDRRSFRPTLSIPMANHSVPNLYRLRINYGQKICGFLLKLSHLPGFPNDSVIQKPPAATLIDLIVVSVWTSPLTSYRLSFAKIIISEIDFLDTASTPNVLTAMQVSFAAAGKS